MEHCSNGDSSGSLFVSCGEVSGDRYSSLLIHALRSRGFDGEIWGMMGPQGSSAGGRSQWDSGSLSLMGISEVLGSVPRLWALKERITDEIISRSPRGVVVIDSPDFHIPLVRTLRKKGYQGRVFYIAPPTVWAWRQGRVKALAEYCDICLPLFDFERAFLEGHGVPCRWYGHPLSGATRETVPADLGQRDGRNVVAMLPGSRSGEVRRLLPQMLIASEGIDRRGFRPVFSVAPGLDSETASFLRGNCEPWETYEGRGTELMAASEMVIGASGTAAVEALILEKFMIVLYKASFSSWLVYKAFVRSPLISIPNILAGGVIYPELLQSDVSAGKILGHFDLYMGSSQQRRTVDESIRATASVLNGGDAPAGWGAAIMEAISS